MNVGDSRSSCASAKRSAPVILFIVAIIWCWPCLQPLSEAGFLVEPVKKSFIDSPPSVLRSGLLPSAGAINHSVTLAQRADGTLIAAWFAGSKESASDVTIYGSTYEGQVWSAPVRIVDRRRLQQETQRFISKLGNPMLWRDTRGTLHLWVVSVSYGGWSCSAINHMQSDDDGTSWSKAKRIVCSPLWNLSTLVRNPPLAMTDGGAAVPAYHELAIRRPEWLRFDEYFRLIDKARLPGSVGTLQPAAVALGEHQVVALMRDGNPLRRIVVAASEDTGQKWQFAHATPMPNPDSALALLRLADGSLLLACNPQKDGRNKLALLRSMDRGQSWSSPLLIEQGAGGEEFSYPALLQGDTGVVHLAYTWNRKAIKHVMFSSSQMEAMR